MDKVEVTQADRHAADDAWRDYIERCGPTEKSACPRRFIKALPLSFALHRRAAVEALTKRVAELEGALKPFAAIYIPNKWHGDQSREVVLKARAFRRASAALNSTKENPNAN